MSKKILFFLSEYGYWGEELIGPLEACKEANFEITFITPHGGKPPALPPSTDPNFIDPPLDKKVTSSEMAEKVKKISESNQLDHPLNLDKAIPSRPFLSEPNYLRKLESYYQNLTSAVESLVNDYDAILLVGGSGPIVDMVNNEKVHAVILGFYNADKPIAAECYGVACLAFARDWDARTSIIKGKHVTGHPKEYDYKDGTGFVGADINMGPPPYPLEYILRDAVAPNGIFHGNVGKELSAIVDYPFITGRSTADSRLTGELLVKVLTDNLQRFGW